MPANRIAVFCNLCRATLNKIKMASKIVPTHEFGESVLDLVIAKRFSSVKLEDQALVMHNFVLPSDVFVMLPVPGDGERKVIVLYFTSIRKVSLRQASGRVDVHVFSIYTN